MKNKLKNWLNKSVQPVTQENTFVPAMGVSDEHRKQFFTTFNEGLINEVRRIKLNQVNK